MEPAEHWSSPLACRFMADLLGRTMGIVDDDAYRREVQAFCNELKPWVQPGDCPNPRPEFTVFSRIDMDEKNDTIDTISVSFTPEGLAFFRVWLRRRGLDPMMGTCLSALTLKASATR
jgi:hypothetical protein